MEKDIATKFANHSLSNDLSKTELETKIKRLTDTAIVYFKSVDDISFHQDWDTERLVHEIDSPIPREPLEFDEMIDLLQSTLIPNFPSTSSKSFLGYIPSDPLPESVAFAALTPLFNQFAGSVQGSPAGTAIESLVITWIIELLDLPPTSFGSFTSGGSMANLTAMYSGLVHQLREKGIDLKEDGLINSKRPIIYISEETHNAIEKAILLLGLGRKSIRSVKPNENFQLTKNAVKKQIEKDLETHGDSIIPLMIVATAGTTNTGSIDDLEGLRELAIDRSMWLHVDGAYGAFSKLSNHPVSEKLEGIQAADSIALDCHKWLYTPFEAGIAIVRDHMILRNAFDLSAEYLVDSELQDDIKLQRNFRSYGFLLTRELRGLKVWATIGGMGLTEIQNAITRDILKAEYLAEKIKQDPRFDLIHTKLSITCFRHVEGEQKTSRILSTLQERKKFYLSKTTINGEVALRVCFLNRRSDLDDVNQLYQELNEICSQL